MKGPLILLAVVGLAAALAYLTWGAGGGAPRERGLAETDHVFALVEERLEALQPDFEFLAARGTKLNMREQHAAIREDYAALRAERLALLDRDDLDPRALLAELRAIRDRGDELLAAVVTLQRKLAARVAFDREIGPLLDEARRRRDRLVARPRPDTEQAERISNLSARLSEIEQIAERADIVLGANLEQGNTLAGTALNELRRLLDEQQALLHALGG